jgi:hypothetical protein
MGISEFAKLLKQANRANKRGDETTFKAIAARLEQIGYRIYTKDDGEVYVENLGSRS